MRLKITKTPEQNKEEKLHGRISEKKCLFSKSQKCKQQKSANKGMGLTSQSSVKTMMKWKDDL